MTSTTYDPTLDSTPAGDLPVQALFAVALHRATTAGSAAESTSAISELDVALHAGPDAFVRQVRAARSANLAERIAQGTSKASLARALGVTPARIDQLLAANAPVLATRQRRRRRAAVVRTSVRDDITRATSDLKKQVLAAREAERAARGQAFLAQIDGGRSYQAVADEAGVSRQQVVAWVDAALAANGRPKRV